jgi:DNA polymerase II small subunit/DNA polymerase delta subunit B
MEFLDKWMLPISYSKQIDVMPGVNDPSNNLMPQQPFQHCFLPECFKNQRVSARTNPYGFT